MQPSNMNAIIKETDTHLIDRALNKFYPVCVETLLFKDNTIEGIERKREERRENMKEKNQIRFPI